MDEQFKLKGHGAAAWPPSCQVENCDSSVASKAFYQRCKVCPYHSQAPWVQIRGMKMRFCHLCKRFQELHLFEGDRKSCRRMMEQHNSRRRERRLVARKRAEGGQGVRGGVKKLVLEDSVLKELEVLTGSAHYYPALADSEAEPVTPGAASRAWLTTAQHAQQPLGQLEHMLPVAPTLQILSTGTDVALEAGVVACTPLTKGAQPDSGGDLFESTASMAAPSELAPSVQMDSREVPNTSPAPRAVPAELASDVQLDLLEELGLTPAPAQELRGTRPAGKALLTDADLADLSEWLPRWVDDTSIHDCNDTLVPQMVPTAQAEPGLASVPDVSAASHTNDGWQHHNASTSQTYFQSAGTGGRSLCAAVSPPGIASSFKPSFACASGCGDGPSVVGWTGNLDSLSAQATYVVPDVARVHDDHALINGMGGTQATYVVPDIATVHDDHEPNSTVAKAQAPPSMPRVFTGELQPFSHTMLPSHLPYPAPQHPLNHAQVGFVNIFGAHHSSSAPLKHLSPPFTQVSGCSLTTVAAGDAQECAVPLIATRSNALLLIRRAPQLSVSLKIVKQ